MLRDIQQKIETLYGIECDHPIEEFLIPPESIASYYAKHPWLAYSDEAMLIESDDENLHLGLHFQPKLLEKYKPFHLEEISSEDISEVGPLIEGVSHFVYFCWKSAQGIPITQLEMELQAEIDKYLLLSLNASAHNHPLLVSELFYKAKLSPHLNEEQKERYELALKLALKFCEKIHKESQELSHLPFLKKIRHFYRKNQTGKMHSILI